MPSVKFSTCVRHSVESRGVPLNPRRHSADVNASLSPLGYAVAVREQAPGTTRLIDGLRSTSRAGCCCCCETHFKARSVFSGLPSTRTAIAGSGAAPRRGASCGIYRYRHRIVASPQLNRHTSSQVGIQGHETSQNTVLACAAPTPRIHYRGVQSVECLTCRGRCRGYEWIINSNNIACPMSSARPIA